MLHVSALQGHHQSIESIEISMQDCKDDVATFSVCDEQRMWASIIIKHF